MTIKYVFLVSRQGKLRLSKWYATTAQGSKEITKTIKDVSQLVLQRKPKQCNFIEHRDTKVVYRKYASLYFVVGVELDDNELIIMEFIHRYVECLDRYFGNVCELDLIFHFQKAYFILDEMVMAGELQESSKKTVLRVIAQQDETEAMENAERGWGDINLEGVARTAMLTVQEFRQSLTR
ncbi:AP-1 adaptor complex sigma subunit Aps1 [Coemansia sp. Benny D160-2]|nr:AP-1 adaptor complex sigma subunit Aps1 [Coemansia sp. Benny D160-2]